MKIPKISIIIPTYNRGNLIKTAILSVIDQTFTDWELLIIDDGSTDNTKEIVQEFIEKDKRIKYFYEEASGGPSSPRNLGIENANGEYVAFLDSDDEWFPTKLQKQLDLFEKSNNPKLGVVACYVYIKDNKTGEIVSKHDTYYKGNVLEHQFNVSNFLFTASCVMTKLSILKEAGLFDLTFKIGSDVDMWIQISKLNYEFDYVPEYLVNYLVHESNIYYDNKNFDHIKEFGNLVNKYHDLFYKYNPSLLAYYYFSLKKYNLARKYFIKTLFKGNSTYREKITLVGHIMITIFPFLKNLYMAIKKGSKYLFKL